jgi:hypothetical protein
MTVIIESQWPKHDVSRGEREIVAGLSTELREGLGVPGAKETRAPETGTEELVLEDEIFEEEKTC